MDGRLNLTIVTNKCCASWLSATDKTAGNYETQ